MANSLIEEIRERIECNADEGTLTWRYSDKMPKAWNTRFAGKPALNSRHGMGYRHGSVNGKHMLAHRVIWALHTGEWPEDEIDHINGDRSDNRIENLRQATHAQQCVNRPAVEKASGAYVGVYRMGDRWQAAAGKGGYLGMFGCETAARVAREVAAQKLWGAFRPRETAA